MRYVVRRVLISAGMLAGLSVVIFAVLRALPGDPVTARLGAAQGFDQAAIDRLRAAAGLDRPLVTQYLAWVSGMLRGDLGDSYFNRMPVSDLIAARLGPTLELTVLAVALSVAVATPAAIAAAVRPDGWADRLIGALASAGMAFPPFVAGILLILAFSVTLRWLPARGFVPLSESVGGNLASLALPAVSLSAVAAPLVLRYLRGELITALASAYARTAEGKGAPRRVVVVRHALRNAALPSLTMLGLIVGYTLGGSVIVEYTFGFSGLGSLSVESAFQRDYAVLQSVVLLVSALFIGVSLAVDLAVWALDPRTRSRRA
ncbi:ABC transporter permease [Sphaerisporangium krabiense]|uniref:Peptide/nickel transport system permease protein n=1 Tax=Sphaerisporangium krabiense TaxID=763782 RepID=A0A7W9DQ35_9ACTN|nr:ABC transporter permease [Sphaerisporangium krabiense]MBB5627142.1 peptide/nickel transport system permease protein [Sphaerisporangium krabiense]